jgi:putative ABC transport system substrate-binding protein
LRFGLLLVLGIVLAPLAQAQTARIGLLSPFSPSATEHWHQAFRQSMREAGWVEGKNLRIEYRYAEGRNDRLPGLAAELVRLKVDVIVASVTTDALVAARATKDIPIVGAGFGDPVAIGLVKNLARPGGNVTGLSQVTPEMGGKRLELLKEIVPALTRVAVLWNPQSPASTLNWKELQLPAKRLGVQLHSLEVRGPEDFAKAFDDAARAGARAVAIMPDPIFATNLKQLAALTVKNRLPAIFHLGEFAEAGGLLAYGSDRSDLFRRAAIYVDKILKGAKPGDLPIEQPTKFELVVNVNTAKALGLTVPPSLLLRADQVIQ